MTENYRQIASSMIDNGGSFAAALGRALINTDSGVCCIQELAKALGPADKENRPKICDLLALSGTILALTQAQRLVLLKGTFPAIWERHEGSADAPKTTGELWPAPLGTDETQEAILAFVKDRQTGRFGPGSARWMDILAHFGEKEIEGGPIDAALNRLLDRGLLYEPTLGIMKVVE